MDREAMGITALGKGDSLLDIERWHPMPAIIERKKCFVYDLVKTLSECPHLHRKKLRQLPPDNRFQARISQGQVRMAQFSSQILGNLAGFLCNVRTIGIKIK
jgi:hypothetical protein